MSTSSINTTTLQLIIQKLIDNSFIAHPLFRAIEEAGNLKDQSGGSRIEQPVIFGQQSDPTYQLTTGFENTPMVFRDPFKSAEFVWCDALKWVGLSLVEKTSNKGELARVNILEAKVKNAMLNLRQEFAQRVFQGPFASANPLTNLQTLNGCTTAASTGWFEGVAAASQDNVVGGLSKVTYRGDNWFNQFVDAGGTLALDDIDNMMIQAQVYNPEGLEPDLIFMSPKCYAAFLKLIQNQVRYIEEKSANGLRNQMVPTWRGARIYVEPTLGFTAEAPAKALSAVILSSNTFTAYRDPDAWFKLGDMMQVATNGGIEAASIHTRFQITTGHLASHAIVLDAEA